MQGFAVDASLIKADANRSRGVAGTETIDWSKGDGPSPAVREYLAALDELNQANDEAAPEAEPATPPKNISLTDPASRWTAEPRGGKETAHTFAHVFHSRLDRRLRFTGNSIGRQRAGQTTGASSDCARRSDRPQVDMTPADPVIDRAEAAAVGKLDAPVAR